MQQKRVRRDVCAAMIAACAPEFAHREEARLIKSRPSGGVGPIRRLSAQIAASAPAPATEMPLADGWARTEPGDALGGAIAFAGARLVSPSSSRACGRRLSRKAESRPPQPRV